MGIQPAPLQEKVELSLPGPELTDLFQAVIQKDSRIRLTVKGFSMFPFIRDEDAVTLSPLEFSPRLGDIVAFSPAETRKLFIHRVVGKKNSAYLTRGDNASSADGFHPRAAILGRVVRVERKGKKISPGLGPERIPIAHLSRKGLLAPILRLVLNVTRPFRKRLALTRFYFFGLRTFQGINVYRKIAGFFREGVNIQEAGITDRENLQKWFHLVEDGPGDLWGPGVTTFLAKRGERIIGHGQLIRYSEERHPLHGYWLHSLVVWEPFRGMGIGESLTQKVISRAKDEGAKELLLTVHEDQEPAVCLYRKLGFQVKRDSAIEDQLERDRMYLGAKKIVMGKLL